MAASWSLGAFLIELGDILARVSAISIQLGEIFGRPGAILAELGAGVVRSKCLRGSHPANVFAALRIPK
jgi:hypothetical protein